jgi:hypothetical protein
MATTKTRYWINNVFSAPTVVYRLQFTPEGIIDETWSNQTKTWRVSDKGMAQITIGDEYTSEVTEEEVKQVFPEIQLD